jgi:hypothetical protein
MTGLLAFLLRLGFDGVVRDAIEALDRRADLAADTDKQRLQATVELAREAVRETEAMAGFNAAKLEYRAFWWLLLAVSGLLTLWMGAVVIDCIPYLRDIFGEQQVHDLPTPALQDAFAAMIKWLFFLGSGVAGLKTLIR